MELLHPGLYVKEIKGISPVEGVSTSTAGFVGIAEKGPINEAILVTNWTQFVDNFGSFMNSSYLAYAVRQFFENGGTRAYIKRVVHLDETGTPTSSVASADIMDESGTNPVIKVTSKNDGAWGNKLAVQVKDFDAVKKTLTLEVYEGKDLVEIYEVLIDELEETVNNSSKYINIVVPSTIDTISTDKVTVTGGKDGIEAITDSDFIGDEVKGTGIYAFDNKNINIIAIPGMTNVPVLTGIVSYAEKRKDCIAILDAPLGSNVSEIATFREENNISSAFATLYYPWVVSIDPIGVGKSPTKVLPPSGAIAGIYARIDNSRGVHKAPAGLEATVIGAIDLEYNMNDAEQDLLNPIGVNCIRAFEGRGIVVWGARTLSSDPEYKYINVRRHVSYVNNTLTRNLDWVVFEPNDEVLWGKVTIAVSDFLRDEWKNKGALRGTNESEAFFVKCDNEINTPESIDLGRVYVDIGLAEQKPAEFVVFRISLKR